MFITLTLLTGGESVVINVNHIFTIESSKGKSIVKMSDDSYIFVKESITQVMNSKPSAIRIS